MIKSQARVLAKENGEKYYTPETPCAKGHFLRKVTGGECVACRKISSTLAIEKDRPAYNARKKKERQHSLPQIAAKAKENRLMESDEAKTLRREKSRLRAIIWRQKNPDHENAKLCKKTYKLNNPAVCQALAVKRRVSKINRTPVWTTETDLWMMMEIYALSELRTRLTGISWHVDHIIPLQGVRVSGLHVPSNLQVIPARENIKKGNKFEVPA